MKHIRHVVEPGDRGSSKNSGLEFTLAFNL
jgi:hypothetical protein